MSIATLSRARVLGMSPLTLIGVLAGAAALFLVPPLVGGFWSQNVAVYLIYGLPALAVGLIAGHARLLNIGVGAIFGISAYAVAILTQHSVLNPIVLMLAAFGAGLLVSVLFSVYAVVATGLEYLLLTLLTTAAFASMPLIFQTVMGGENGLTVKGPVVISFGLDPLNGNGFYWLCCAITCFWLGLSWYLLTSRAGRVTVAIGRNPARAAAMGYSVHGYQIGITVYSSLIAACGGWLYALNSNFVFQDLLGIQGSLNAVLYSLIGGVEWVIGPLLGTVALRHLENVLGQQTTLGQLYTGIALLLVVYLLPAGLIGLVRQLWQLRGRIRGEREPVEEVDLDAVLRGTTEEA